MKLGPAYRWIANYLVMGVSALDDELFLPVSSKELAVTFVGPSTYLAGSKGFRLPLDR